MREAGHGRSENQVSNDAMAAPVTKRAAPKDRSLVWPGDALHRRQGSHVSAAIVADLLGRIGGGLLVEALPALGEVIRAAAVDVDAGRVLEDRGCRIGAAVVGAYRDERAAAADPFGIDMCLVLGNARIGERAEQSTGDTTDGGACDRADRGREQPAACNDWADAG